MRDNSRFSRQGSNFRAYSRTGSSARSSSFVKQIGILRGQSKSIEILKSKMFTKVEKLEKEFEQFKKSQNEIKDILKNKLISTQFVEEEIVIDVKYVNEGQERMMLIDSGVGKSIVSSRWFDGYMQDAKVDEESVKRKSCTRRFRMGKLCI